MYLWWVGSCLTLLHLPDRFGKRCRKTTEFYYRANCGRKTIIVRILEPETGLLFCFDLFWHMLYQLLRKVRRRVREARRLRETLLSFLYKIALVMFPHWYHSLIFFASSLGSNSGVRKMERIFSAAHLQTVAFKSKSEAAKGVLRHSAADRASSRIDADNDMVGKGRIVVKTKNQARRSLWWGY